MTTYMCVPSTCIWPLKWDRQVPGSGKGLGAHDNLHVCALYMYMTTEMRQTGAWIWQGVRSSWQLTCVPSTCIWPLKWDRQVPGSGKGLGAHDNLHVCALYMYMTTEMRQTGAWIWQGVRSSWQLTCVCPVHVYDHWNEADRCLDLARG